MKPAMLLRAIFREILREAESNVDFGTRLARTIESEIGTTLRQSGVELRSSNRVRARNRREGAVLDPIELADQGESVLRERLSVLSIEQLKDVIADFGMDTDKLALKWKSADRLVERIVQVSLARSKKGDAFM